MKFIFIAYIIDFFVHEIYIVHIVIILIVFVRFFLFVRKDFRSFFRLFFQNIILIKSRRFLVLFVKFFFYNFLESLISFLLLRLKTKSLILFKSCRELLSIRIIKNRLKRSRLLLTRRSKRKT